MGILRPNRNNRGQQRPNGQNNVAGPAPQQGGQQPQQQPGQQPQGRERGPVLKAVMGVLFGIGALCAMYAMFSLVFGDGYIEPWVIWMGVLFGGVGILPAILMAKQNDRARGRRR